MLFVKSLSIRKQKEEDKKRIKKYVSATHNN